MTEDHKISDFFHNRKDHDTFWSKFRCHCGDLCSATRRDDDLFTISCKCGYRKLSRFPDGLDEVEE